MKPTTIANYKVLEKIGEGGMGTVYKAEDLTLGRLVAIKILHPHLLADSMVIDRFKSEARTLANLNHPALATLYNFISFEDTYCMVMEFVEGKTLSQILKEEESISPDRAIDYCTQVLEGLQHAHAQGVIHRDIKPSNIIINERGCVKVMDFGIARIIGSQRLTRTGTMIGTLEYMSPEQIKGEEGDEAADIYAVGTVLYELICGALPFTAESEFLIIQEKISKSPTAIRQISAGVSRQLSQVIMKAISTSTTKRYQSVDDFKRALEGSQVQGDPSQVRATSTLSLLSGKHLLFSVAGLVLLVIAFLMVNLSESAEEGITDTEEARPELVQLTQNTSRVEGTFEPRESRALPSLRGVQVSTMIDSLFKEAEDLFENESYLQPAENNARAICKRILGINPRNEDALGLLKKMARIYEEKGDQQVLLDDVEAAMESFRNSLSCFHSIAVQQKISRLKEGDNESGSVEVEKKVIQPRMPKSSRPVTIPVPVTKSEKEDEQEEASLMPSKTNKEKETTSTTSPANEEPVAESETTEGNEKEIKHEPEVKTEKVETRKKQTVYVRNGSELEATLRRSVSSEDKLEKYDRIELIVKRDIESDGVIVIKRGARVHGYVSQIKSTQQGGRAVLELEFEYVEAASGDFLPLKASSFRLLGKNGNPAYFPLGQAFSMQIQKDHALTL